MLYTGNITFFVGGGKGFRAKGGADRNLDQIAKSAHETYGVGRPKLLL